MQKKVTNRKLRAFIHSSLDDFGLPLAPFRVYCHLARSVDVRSFPVGMERIARVCGINIKTAQKAIRHLEEIRMIRVDRRHRSPNVYTILDGSVWVSKTTIKEKSCAPIQTIVDTQKEPSIDTQTDTHQGYPSEGSPLEGNPLLAKKQKRFAPPSLDQVFEYGKSISVEPDQCEQFFDYWTGFGWKNKSGRSVQDWKACLRTWKRNIKNFSPRQFNNSNNSRNPLDTTAREYWEMKNGPKRSGHPKPDYEKCKATQTW